MAAAISATLLLAACGGGGRGSTASTSTSAGATTTSASPRTVGAVSASWHLAAPVAREVVVPDRDHFTIVGGLDATKYSTSAIVRVDPSTGVSQPAGRLAEAVHDAAGARLAGHIVVFGGGGPSENGTADVQSVASSGQTAIVSRLPQPRSDHVVATVDGTTYVLGGYDGSTIVSDVLATTDGVTFTRVGALPVPVRYPAVAVIGTAVYVFGGVTNSAAGVDTDAVQRLDTRTGAIGVVAHLPSSLSHASAIVLDGFMYLLGGYVDNRTLSDQILRFDATSGATATAGRLPEPVSDAGAVVVGGKGYLVGGEGVARAPIATVIVVARS